MNISTNRFLKPTEELCNLMLLEEIDKNPTVSQRKLSKQLGVALGVTNACLKKLINKGLVVAKGTNHKRITYYLTMQGISAKSTLTDNFLNHTITYYSELKNRVNSSLDKLTRNGHKNLLCYGAGEVMELVFIVLNSTRTGLNLLGIVDDDKCKQGKKIFGHIIAAPKLIKVFKPEAVLVTSVKFKDEIVERISKDETIPKVEVYLV